MMTMMPKIARDEQGVAAVEYGLIISMIVLAMVAGLSQVADSTGGMWNYVSETIRAA